MKKSKTKKSIENVTFVEPQVHSCKFYYGKIVDVTLRGRGIAHCKRCGRKLFDSQIDKKTLKIIKEKRDIPSKKYG